MKRYGLIFLLCLFAGTCLAQVTLLAKRGIPTVGFQPTDISGCLLWLAADQSELSGYSAWQRVPIWYDKSGNGYNATNDIEASQPLYTNGVINSKPAIYFDASETTNTFLIAPIPAASQANTIVVVAKSDRLMDGREYVYDGNVNNERHLLAIEGNASGFVSSYSGEWLVGSAASDTSFHIWTAIFNGTGGKLYRDASQVASANVGTQPLRGLNIGINYQRTTDDFSGYIAEIIVYDSGLSDANRNQVETFLNAKYAIY